MSAANLDAVKKKYKFKEIAVATWRDPSLSVLSARGNVSSDAAGRPYIPTYKVKYNTLPEPTDDEDSGSEGEKEPAGPDRPLPAIENLESLIDDTESHEPLPEVLESEQNDEVADLPAEGSVDPEPETSPETQGNLNEDIPQRESTDQSELESVEAPASEREAVNDTKTVEHDHGEIVAVDEGEAVQSGSPVETAPDPPELLPPLESAMEPEVVDDIPSDEHIDERRVSFAPGTPEPKPTPRKKKAAKGTKSKKKRIAVPLDDVPADILAMIDSSFDGILPPPPPPPPAPEIPGESDDLPPADVTEHQPIAEEQDESLPEGDASSDPPKPDELEPPNESKVDVPMLPESQASDDQPSSESLPLNEVDENFISSDQTLAKEASQDPIDTDDGPVASEPSQQDPISTVAIDPEGAEPEKASKKKSSKSSKDKSKKKSSKNRSKESSPPPAGLGIDIGPRTLLEIGDLPQDGPPNVEDMPSNDIVPDAEDAAIAPPALPETENQEEPFKDSPGEEPEPALSETQPHDALSENFDENNEETEVQVDSPTPQIDSIDDKSEAQEIENGGDLGSETPKPSGEEPEGQDRPTTDNVSSPADSGIEFEDLGKAAPDAGEEPSSSTSESSDVTQIDLPKEEGTTNVSKDEQDPIPELVPPGEGVPIEDLLPTSEPSDEVEVESESKEPESSDDVPSTKAEPVAVTEGSDEPPPEDVAETQPGPDSTEASVDQEGVAGPDIDEIVENDSASQEAASPEGESSVPRELEPEAASDVKLDEVEPEKQPLEAEAEAEDKEPEVPQSDPPVGEAESEAEPEAPLPDPPAEKVEPNMPKSMDEAIFDGVSPSDSPAPDEQPIDDHEPGPEAPPSPNLSKTSSSGSRESKDAHWKRKHKENALKDVFEDSTKFMARSKGGKDGLRIGDRAQKSRRLSSTEEDEARRQRRRLRKAQEVAARLVEEQKKFDEDKQRRIQREERRAARKAEAEVLDEKITKLHEEAARNRASRVDDEARRKRHRDRDRDREPAASHSHTDAKDFRPSLKLRSLTLPRSFGLTNGQSTARRQDRRADELQAAAPSKHKEQTSPRERHKDRPVDNAREEGTRPSSSSGSKSHHRHHHRHRSDSDRPSQNSRESDHNPRRPVTEEERPRSFFGLLRSVTKS